MALLKTIVTLLIFLALEPVKRVLSFVFYLIVAYPFRDRLRNFKRVLWPTYLYEPARGLHSFLLWCMLDDSIRMEQDKEYDDKEKRYPAWIWRRNSPRMKAWWWSAVRNSCVNWNNASAWLIGRMVHEEDHKDKRNFYVIRTFDSGAKRPYTEFYLFGRWFQFGWLSCGRFEIDLFKKR